MALSDVDPRHRTIELGERSSIDSLSASPKSRRVPGQAVLGACEGRRGRPGDASTKQIDPMIGCGDGPSTVMHDRCFPLVQAAKPVRDDGDHGLGGSGGCGVSRVRVF